MFNDLSPQERDYSPLFTGVMYGSLGWMTCPPYTNPDGSFGFYAPNNAYLLEQYGDYALTLTTHYHPGVRFIERATEPPTEFAPGPRLLALERLEHRPAVATRHLEVGHDAVKARLGRQRERLVAVSGARDHVAVELERVAEEAADAGIVVDHQDVRHRRCLT